MRSTADILADMLASTGLEEFLKTYNVATSVVLSLATITVIIMIIFNITKLSKAGDNPMERRASISGIFVCSVCFMLLGGIDIVYALMLNLILG